MALAKAIIEKPLYGAFLLLLKILKGIYNIQVYAVKPGMQYFIKVTVFAFVNNVLPFRCPVMYLKVAWPVGVLGSGPVRTTHAPRILPVITAILCLTYRHIAYYQPFASVSFTAQRI